MSEPLGRFVGNAVEVWESIQTLEGWGPEDVESLSIHLAARMVRLAGKAASVQEAEGLVREALSSGRGLEKLRAIIAQQGGDPRVIDDPKLLPAARHTHSFRAPCSGFITRLDAEKIGRAAMLLGAGRNRVEDKIDPAAGILLLAVRGEEVKEDTTLAELYYSDASRLPNALALVQQAYRLGDEAPPPRELLLETRE
jgi:thymidine phosphorylase